ncbi:hypothetical protein L6164_026281 [Bauhinia variegata]|uniref:Uncharacterized protein n=1 Tax=Bauhinia variegata TaxID=167791 RepID=A0ACB9LPN4_BAUVA|nr:hypothetical protein L6164_026281 [Bauhinia variegata]
MLVRLCKDPGILPVNLLKHILNTRSLGSLSPTSLGNSPHKSLAASAKLMREDKLYKDGGTVPVSLLIVRSSSTRFLSRPKSFGILPLRMFVPKLMFVRDEMFPRDGGIIP